MNFSKWKIDEWKEREKKFFFCKLNIYIYIYDNNNKNIYMLIYKKKFKKTSTSF